MQYLPAFEGIPLPKYNIGLPIDNNTIAQEKRNSHVVSYEYISVGNKQYDFGQDAFTANDALNYFDFMNWLCLDDFESVFISADKDWHFHGTDYFKNRTFREAVNNRLGLKDNFLPEEVPEFYHFALNTTDEITTKAHQTTSPRIFFFLAGNSVIYMLFCDMYHELEEIKKNEKETIDR